MGKRGKRGCGKSLSSSGGGRRAGEYELDVDIAAIRFQHSRVSRSFTGCGVQLEETLRQIVDGELEAAQLPMITVLHSADSPDAYFSLNNRRLWVFKQLHAQGLLATIRVPCREMTPKERARYTVERCAVQARLMNDTPGSRPAATPSGPGGGAAAEFASAAAVRGQTDDGCDETRGE